MKTMSLHGPLPSNCFSCGAVLRGSATKHSPSCSIYDLTIQGMEEKAARAESKKSDAPAFMFTTPFGFKVTCELMPGNSQKLLFTATHPAMPGMVFSNENCRQCVGMAMEAASKRIQSFVPQEILDAIHAISPRAAIAALEADQK